MISALNLFQAQATGGTRRFAASRGIHHNAQPDRYGQGAPREGETGSSIRILTGYAVAEVVMWDALKCPYCGGRVQEIVAMGKKGKARCRGCGRAWRGGD